jgi:UDP-glucose 4-epimerase
MREAQHVKVLVTGGAGYIGSTVTCELVRNGHQVVVYDNLSRGHRQALPQAAELCVGEIGDRAALEAVFRTRAIEAVMHFAALIEVGESMKVPEQYFQSNTAGTLTLLEVMLAHGVNRFVFSSTAALYGNPGHAPINETDPLQPTNVYGESKHLVERILEWLRDRRGLRYASLRYFNAAGAAGPDVGEDHQPESHLIPLVLKVALRQRQFISIYGSDYPTPDGTCVRDYIHVCDLASAHLLALEALAHRDQLICNLGNGLGFSVRQVIEMARQVTRLPIPAVESPRRPGDPAVLVASSERIRRELGWQPRFPDLESIVSSAWEWHRRHPRGYEDS